MGENTKGRRTFQLEQLEQVQKLLRELPKKDTRTTRQEAMEFLKHDLQSALGKGYTAKELAAYLKERKQAIPVQLITDAVRGEAKTAHNEADEVRPPKPMSKAAKVPSASELNQEVEKQTTRGSFEIIPDRPDDEL